MGPMRQMRFELPGNPKMFILNRGMSFLSQIVWLDRDCVVQEIRSQRTAWWPAAMQLSLQKKGLAFMLLRWSHVHAACQCCPATRTSLPHSEVQSAIIQSSGGMAKSQVNTT